MRISLLCPAHDEEDHIAEMIASLRAQTHPDWEALFVDDGSTDATASLIEAAAAEDPRISLVSRGTRLGKVQAFNTAFAASTGGLIALAGCDDTLPVDSLAVRAAALQDVDPSSRQVAYFKLRTFSDDPRFDGMVLPRGAAPSRSGGSITMTRGLAEIAFPIDTSLVAEDIWLNGVAEAYRDREVLSARVVLNYRIHAGNSNPRQAGFGLMNESMHRRQLAYRALLESDRLDLPARSRTSLERRALAEEHRYHGRVGRVLTSEVPLVDRLALVSMAHPLAHRLRSHFYRLFSGLRGR